VADLGDLRADLFETAGPDRLPVDLGEIEALRRFEQRADVDDPPGVGRSVFQPEAVALEEIAADLGDVGGHQRGDAGEVVDRREAPQDNGRERRGFGRHGPDATDGRARQAPGGGCQLHPALQAARSFSLHCRSVDGSGRSSPVGDGPSPG